MLKILRIIFLQSIVLSPLRLGYFSRQGANTPSSKINLFLKTFAAFAFFARDIPDVAFSKRLN